MVYEHEGWKLHKKDVKLGGGKIQRIYFFAKKKPKSGIPCDLPKGYKVIITKNTGAAMPLLKKT